jgi:hypothetical protein
VEREVWKPIYKKYKYVAVDTQDREEETPCGEENMWLFERNRAEPETPEIDANIANSTVDEFSGLVSSIKDLGIEARDLEKSLLESVEAVAGITNEDLVPCYDVAIKIASDGIVRGREVLSSYSLATEAINRAERLIRIEYENQGSIQANIFQQLILSPSLELLKEAKVCLKNGEFERVHEIVEQIRSLPRKAKEECLKSAEMFRYCEEILDEMREEGIAAHEVEDVVEIARKAFLNGMFSRVKELAEVVEQKSIHLRERYRNAVRAIDEAKEAVSALEEIGFESEEANEYLTSAAQCMESGGYGKGFEWANKSMEVAVDLCRQYWTLDERIVALREELKKLEEAGKSIPDDVKEILSRAEEELKEGDYENSEEDLDLASLMAGRFELAS